MKIKLDKDDAYVYYAVAVVVALIYTVLYMLTPVMLDDVAFGRYMAGFKAEPSFGGLFGNWWASVRELYATDNGRLFNMLAIVLLLLPKCLTDVLCGVAVYVLITQGARLAGVWRRNLAGYALWVAIVVFLLPWYDFMFTFVFAGNYLIASALLVWALRLMLARRFNNICVPLLLGLFVGWMHEAAAVAGIGATLALIICFGQYRRPCIFAWLAGFVIALLIIALSPAAAVKGANIIVLGEAFNLLKRPDMSAPFYLFCIILTCGLCSAKWRKYFYRPRVAMLFGGALGAWGVCRLALFDGYRPAWQMIVLSGIALAYFLSLYARRSTVAKNVISLCVLAVCIVQPLACVPWFGILRAEVEGANRAMAQADSSQTVFVPMHNDATQAWYTLNKAQFGLYAQKGFPFCRAVPQELADFEPATAEQLVGAYYYKGNIVMPYEPQLKGWAVVSIDYGPGEFWPQVVLTPFQTPAGKFVYVHTINAFSKLQFFTPKAVQLIAVEDATDVK